MPWLAVMFNLNAGKGHWDPRLQTTSAQLPVLRLKWAQLMTHSTQSLTQETQWPPLGFLSSYEAQQHYPAQFAQHNPTSWRESKYQGLRPNYHFRIYCHERNYETLPRKWKPPMNSREVGSHPCEMSKSETSSPSMSSCREEWAVDAGSELGFPFRYWGKSFLTLYRSWLRLSACLPDPPAVNQESRLPNIYQLTRQLLKDPDSYLL